MLGRRCMSILSSSVMMYHFPHAVKRKQIQRSGAAGTERPCASFLCHSTAVSSYGVVARSSISVAIFT